MDFLLVPFSVVKNLRTFWTEVFHVSLLGADSLVVCACENGLWKLKKYSLQLDKLLHQATLKNRPTGMTGIVLNGECCLALSNRCVLVRSSVLSNTCI